MSSFLKLMKLDKKGQEYPRPERQARFSCSQHFRFQGNVTYGCLPYIWALRTCRILICVRVSPKKWEAQIVHSAVLLLLTTYTTAEKDEF